MKFDHIAVNSTNIQRSVEWYCKSLGCVVEYADETWAMINCDGTKLALVLEGSHPPHIAFKVKDRKTLLEYKNHLENNGINVLGVVDHSIFHSIYFFDPNGHRLELACPDEEEKPKLKMLDDVKWAMLEEWSQTKQAPKHAAWMHEKAFDSDDEN